MTAARTHRSGARERDVRLAKRSNAAAAIGTLTARCEIYVLTFGQFSLIDALHHLLTQTGPADVTLSTWTASGADLTRAKALTEQAAIRSIRVLVDRSFLTRQPDYCTTLRRLFGDACIRTARSHAKFATIRNDAWQLAVRTSMNLNENPRLENIEISDDPALCGFLESVVSDVFAEQPSGEFAGEFPDLASLPDVPSPTIRSTPSAHVQIGRITTGPPT